MSNLNAFIYQNILIFIFVLTLFILLIYDLVYEIPWRYCYVVVAYLFCFIVIIVYSYRWLFFYYYELLFPMLARYNNVLILLFLSTLFLIFVYALEYGIPVHIQLFCLVVITIYSYMWLFYLYYQLLFPTILV